MSIIRRLLVPVHSPPPPRGGQMRVPCGDRDCGHRVCEIARDAYDEGFADGVAAASDE